ncbi:uncharacterized protein [Mytilus edulis]|uniref:uncharacterized protein n=1 Tax=Mytilus edulis TaxID=6550 RepID=UPI0039F0F10D
MSGEMTIAQSNEYQSFRSSVSQRKFVVDEDESKEWKVYDAGPRSVKCPLICFPPASGTADVFFRQILALTAVGYRVISVEYPTYWKIVEFCEGFRRLIDHLQLDKVHLFGASLGGFLAQKFAEYTYRSPRVASLILCNSFYDTTIFNQTNSAQTFWMMPSLVLKKMVMGNFDKGLVDPSICDSIDFLVEKLDGLTQAELASRLTLNCMNCYVEPQKIQQIPITIMDVFDDCALSHSVREELYKCYPEAKRAHLKSGGNFPYLSRCDEVDIFIKIHLQPFDNKKYSAKEYVKPGNCSKAVSWKKKMAEMSDGCCCIRKRRMRVGPTEEGLPELIEVRPHRHIRIKHINPRPREELLQTELKVYLDNLKIALTTPRVVTVPRLNANRNIDMSKDGNSRRFQTNNHTEQLPNMATHSNNNSNGTCISNELTMNNVNVKHEELTPGKRPLSNKENSDLHSESRASVLSTGERSVMSSAGVHVSMDPMNKQKVEKPSTAHSVIAETDEPLSSRSSHSIAMHNGLPPSLYSPRRQSSHSVHKDKSTANIPKSFMSPRKSIVSRTHEEHINYNVAKPVKDKELVIFFIHGVGGSSDIWNAQLNYFEKLNCEIISFDLIGHGLSDAPDKKSAYTFDQILVDITEIFDKFCKRRNVVVAHSYGCAFASVIARERRKWVSKLVLVSGGGPTPLAPQPGVFSLPLCLLACCRPCLNRGFQRGAFHPSFKKSSDREKAFDVPTYVLSYVMNGQHWPDGDDLYHSWINVPTLLVYGQQDGLVDKEEEEEMTKTIYGSHLEVVEDAGHMVMMEAPGKFNQLLYNFITDQPLSTSAIEPDTHRIDTEDDRHMARSQVSLHSIRSSKSMPHGLLSSSLNL